MSVCCCAIPAMYGGCGNCRRLRQDYEFYYKPETSPNPPQDPIDYDKLAKKLAELMRDKK